MNEKLKECLYCGSGFTREQFPRTFDRMITCGEAKCAEKRRIELWRARYEEWKATRSVA